MGLSSATGWRRQWLSGRANPWLAIISTVSIFLQARYEVGAASKSAQKAEKLTGAAPGAKPNARWLRALQQTTDEQQRHYYRLAQQRFSALPTLEQLRQRAFGFAPGAAPVSFSAFCADLLAAPTSYLACKKIETVEIIASQGFALPLSHWRRQPVADDSPIAFSFYPQTARYVTPAPTSEAAPLLHLSAQFSKKRA